ncbi:unnamed protein product [Angiostrongylus costaricensis]|uniref:GATOR complex protein NPRL3 n=1 Tax=Angiostrongylus costaricensis TaxID=334426 RepID=A0A158PGL9_ANGCS|nr:unnamed protein product [Angiostrongylus costaricensis]
MEGLVGHRHGIGPMCVLQGASGHYATPPVLMLSYTAYTKDLSRFLDSDFSVFGFLIVFYQCQRFFFSKVFVDNFIEVGFCVQIQAFTHAHLTPKSRAEIDKIVKKIRPYHGILLLEDVWPSPDANPSVTLLLKHCEPDRSILDISTASGLPLLQVFLIVRHLLLWARAIVIYPLCNANVYSSATYPKPLGRYISLFSQQFGPSFHLADVLAQFDPPSSLGVYLNSHQPLADQQNRAKVIVALLRHQLILQVFYFYFLLKCLDDAFRRKSFV